MRESLYLDPTLNYPSGTFKVRDLNSGTVVISRDFSRESPVCSRHLCDAYMLACEAPSTEQWGKCGDCCESRCSSAREPTETSSGESLVTLNLGSDGDVGAGRAVVMVDLTAMATAMEMTVG